MGELLKDIFHGEYILQVSVVLKSMVNYQSARFFHWFNVQFPKVYFCSKMSYGHV